jgi:hypothetical protein
LAGLFVYTTIVTLENVSLALSICACVFVTREDRVGTEALLPFCTWDYPFPVLPLFLFFFEAKWDRARNVGESSNGHGYLAIRLLVFQRQDHERREDERRGPVQQMTQDVVQQQKSYTRRLLPSNTDHVGQPRGCWLIQSPCGFLHFPPHCTASCVFLQYKRRVGDRRFAQNKP